MIDFNGYSREFLGGESHAAISLMSERLWDKVGSNVIGFLDENPGYELIICGHSLGGTPGKRTIVIKSLRLELGSLCYLCSLL